MAALGVPGLHFHDLRHTDNTLAADMGVSLRNFMARMGHDNERAALIYQHASNKADRKVAEGLDALLKKARPSRDDDGGAAGTCMPVAYLPANCPAAAHRAYQDQSPDWGSSPWPGLSSCEWVTGIEPALPAWEAYGTWPSWALTCSST